MIKMDNLLRDDDMEDREEKKRIIDVTDKETTELIQKITDVISAFGFDDSDETNAGTFAINCDNELQLERRTFVLHSVMAALYTRLTILSGGTKAHTLRIIDGLMAPEDFIKEQKDNLEKLHSAGSPKSKEALN